MEHWAKMEYFFSGIVFYCVQHDNFDLNCFEDSFLQIHSGSSNLTLLITSKKNTEIFICFFMRWELFKMNKSKQDLGSICRSKYWPTQIFFSANPFFFKIFRVIFISTFSQRTTSWKKTKQICSTKGVTTGHFSLTT